MSVSTPVRMTPEAELAGRVRALLWSLDPARHDGRPLADERGSLLEGLQHAVRAGMPGAMELEAVLSVDPDALGGWDKWRRAALPAYEAFAALVREAGHAAPSLRPSNPTRAVFHVLGGTSAAMMVAHVLPPDAMVPAALGVAACAWSMELARRQSDRVNRFLMWAFGPVAHAHEAWRVNSATWFSTALVVVAWMQSPVAALVAFLVLGWADPAAGIVGRRYGRTRLVHGRSLEGTVTFAVVGAVVAWAALLVWHPELAVEEALLVALGGAIPGAIAELFARRVDDNLAIPVVAGLGALGVMMALG